MGSISPTDAQTNTQIRGQLALEEFWVRTALLTLNIYAICADKTIERIKKKRPTLHFMFVLRAVDKQMITVKSARTS